MPLYYPQHALEIIESVLDIQIEYIYLVRSLVGSLLLPVVFVVVLLLHLDFR